MVRPTCSTAILADRERRAAQVRTRRYLSRQVAVVIGALAVIVLVLALPDLAPPSDSAVPITAAHGRIVAFLEPQAPLDPDDPGAGQAADVEVELLDGPDKGERIAAYLQGPSGQLDLPTYKIGDEVVVTATQQDQGPAFAAISDRWRLPFLVGLTAAFALAVVAVGGGRGLRAVLALALTIALVLKVVIPLVLQGVPPLPLAVVVATGVTVVSIGMTEGFSAKSVSAIIGTAASLGLTALLAAIATALAQFTNAAGSDLVYLQTESGDFDLHGLLLAAFIFGALGVLDDVTVTQAAAVEELAERGGLGGARLFLSAMNIGRSHVAATVNTLFLAYVGASLPLLVLFALSEQPPALVLNGEIVAVEIVRTMVGSLGIVAAVPLTTAIAVWLAAPRRRRLHPTGEIGA
jgi:uncharacterized membrane protein